MNQEDADQEFSIPSEMVDKLYELSGGVDKYKGIIMAVSTDAGRPLIYQRFDCGMTELALSKALEDFLSREGSEIRKEDDQEEE
mgnify:FL=1|jgi:hypothetical protein|tara:strand:+ start:179 stop:430 length:252 start_codon:yes stop_codon:yes gene_type:complete